MAEGIELRKAGFVQPILNMGYTSPGSLSAAIAGRLALTVYDRSGLELLKTAGTEIGVHVKVDSGMHRLGAPPEQAVQLAREIDADRDLRLEGFWTHFANADADAALAAAHDTATEIAANPPLTVHGIKDVLDQQRISAVSASLRYVAAWNAAFLPSKDLTEGISATFAKRPPQFTGE